MAVILGGRGQRSEPSEVVARCAAREGAVRVHNVCETVSICRLQ